MEFYTTIPQQMVQRRHSFPSPPPQINEKLGSLIFTRTTSPVSSHQSTEVTATPLIKTGSDANLSKYNIVYPLTEENLAIHTEHFPPCKDARRRNTHLFVENQRPVIELERILEKQREQEIAAALLEDQNIFSGVQQQQKKWRTRSWWIKRIKHWIRLDSIKKKDGRRSSWWSAGMDKHHRDSGTINSSVAVCQKQHQQRDSGISMGSGGNKRKYTWDRMRSLPIVAATSITMARQQQQQQQRRHIANYALCSTHHEESPLEIHHHSSFMAAS